MNRLRATSLIGAAVALGTAAAVAVSPASRSDAATTAKPNIDALASAKRAKSAAPALKVSAKRNTKVQTEDRLGVPTFVWATRDMSDRGVSAAKRDPATAKLTGRARAEALARHHLDTYAPSYGLTSRDVDNARTTVVHDTGRGAKIVKLQQEIGGIEVFREETAIVMDRQDNLIAIGGYLTGESSTAGRTANVAGFRLSATDALSKAFADLTGDTLEAAAISAGQKDAHGYVRLARASGKRGAVEKLREDARAKQVWFHLPDALQAAYYVELEVGEPLSSDTEMFSYVISATDGSILMRNDLTSHADAQTFSYSMWADADPSGSSYLFPQDGPQGNAYTPHPGGPTTGTQPTFGPAATLAVRNYPFSRNDAWLPLGATETVGNNVDAYADLAAPDGYQPGFGDYRADLAGALSFARTFDPMASPKRDADQIKAAVAQLFYVNNFLHDWYYDSGFDENARNAQLDNYGRGGIAGDPIKAEAQDYGGRNNANMSTPADGNRPRMQMYVFDPLGNVRVRFLTPADIMGVYAPGLPTLGTGATSWPGQPSTPFNVEGNVVYIDDGVAASGGGTNRDGCEAPTASTWAGVTGKIALVDRGACTFILKAKNAQDAGAIGVIIGNVATSGSRDTAPGMAGDGTTQVTTPTFSLGYTVAQQLRCKLGVSTDCGAVTPQTVDVTVRMTRDAAVDRDGTVDYQIVAHEWGHYLTNRLVGNANGLTTQMARGMGEGWADFVAVLMTVREEDRNAAGNDQYQGTYSVAGFTQSGGENGGTNNGLYYGIRRTPQSTDLTKNGLTFKNISAEGTKPTSPLLSWDNGYGPGGPHQVHNTGEVWSAMLWECYASLLRDTTGATPRLTFAEARRRMTDYLVAALKMTPTQPTLLEARDAVLAAAYAGDPQDYVLFARAFAKRGAGESAVGPDRFDLYHRGIVEDFTSNVEMVTISASLAEDTVACLAGNPAAPVKDGIIDAGDTAVLTLTVKNIGETALPSFTGTISSTNTLVGFPAGTTVTVPAIAPLSIAQATVKVSLDATATGEQLIDLKVDWADADLPDVSFATRGNHDEVTSVRWTDDFETFSLAGWGANYWSATNTPTPGWSRYEKSATEHWLRLTNSNQISDIHLLTPAFRVGQSPFIFSFKHRYEFETEGGVAVPRYYDGAVIEITQDGGATWTDIGLSAYPRGTGNVVLGISATTPGNSANPLAGRPAFVGQSAGYAAGTFQTVTLNLGTTYAGKIVQVRFRSATDGFRGDTSQHGAGLGWDVDDVSVSGAPLPMFVGRVPQKCGNRAPAATALTPANNSSIAEGTAVNLAITAGDADGDALTYAWAQYAGPSVTLTGADTATPSFTAPQVSRAGAALTFFVSVYDGMLRSNYVTNYAVTNVNLAPVTAATYTTVDPLLAGLGHAPEGSLVQLDAAATEPDGEAMTYAWEQTAGPAVVLTSSVAAKPLFAAPQVLPAGATLTFRVTVSDPNTAATGPSNALSASSEVSVMVSNVNKPPKAHASAPPVADERSTVVLDASGSTDDDGEALTVAWTQTAGPTVVLSDATVAKPTFVAPDVTTATDVTFKVVAADAAGPNPDAAAEVTISIRNVNRAPTANAGSAQTVKAGDTVTLDASQSVDIDGDAITYAWTQTAGPSAMLGNRNSATPTFKVPAVTQTTVFTFLVTVKDASGATASASVNVTAAAAAAGGCSSTGGGAAPFAAMMLLAMAALRRRTPSKR